MALSKTHNTQHWNTIPRKCKNCVKAIYTIEDGEVYYQCSLFGKFKKECDLKTQERELPKPDKIMEND